MHLNPALPTTHIQVSMHVRNCTAFFSAEIVQIPEDFYVLCGNLL